MLGHLWPFEGRRNLSVCIVDEQHQKLDVTSKYALRFIPGQLASDLVPYESLEPSRKGLRGQTCAE